MSCDCIVIAAHPDDAEIGMGGTIASVIENGHSLVLVDLTDGEPTPYGSTEQRKLEWQAASNVLGIKERENLGLSNRELKDDVKARKALANLIRKFKPAVIFAPYFDDAHPDHIAASQLTVAARFYAKFQKTDLSFEAHYPGKVFYYFSTHMQVKYNPSFLFDISNTIDKKLAALKCYKSQFIDNPANTGIFERVKVTNAYWGQQAGCTYAEPFVCKEHIKIDSLKALLNA